MVRADEMYLLLNIEASLIQSIVSKVPADSFVAGGVLVNCEHNFAFMSVQELGKYDGTVVIIRIDYPHPLCIWMLTSAQFEYYWNRRLQPKDKEAKVPATFLAVYKD